jgi:hypothetical protein
MNKIYYLFFYIFFLEKNILLYSNNFDMESIKKKINEELTKTFLKIKEKETINFNKRKKIFNAINFIKNNEILLTIASSIIISNLFHGFGKNYSKIFGGINFRVCNDQDSSTNCNISLLKLFTDIANKYIIYNENQISLNQENLTNTNLNKNLILSNNNIQIDTKQLIENIKNTIFDASSFYLWSTVSSSIGTLYFLNKKNNKTKNALKIAFFASLVPTTFHFMNFLHMKKKEHELNKFTNNLNTEKCLILINKNQTIPTNNNLNKNEIINLNKQFPIIALQIFNIKPILIQNMFNFNEKNTNTI